MRGVWPYCRTRAGSLDCTDDEISWPSNEHGIRLMMPRADARRPKAGVLWILWNINKMEYLLIEEYSILPKG